MSASAEPLRIWRFSIEDENGDRKDITPEGPPIIAYKADAAKRAEVLADDYELETGALVLKVWYESQGKV